MRCLFTIVLLTISAVAWLPIPGVEASGIFTTITTDKSIYTSTESIDICVSVSNAGSDPVTIAFPSSLQLYYGVAPFEIDSYIYNVKYHVNVLWWLTSLTLEPGQSVSANYSGAGDYGAWTQVWDDGSHVKVPGYYIIYGLLDTLEQTEYEVGCKIIAVSDDLMTPAAAVFSSRTLAAVGEDILFDASSSADVAGDNSQLTYRWDWNGDGVYDTDWTTDPVARHSYSQSGEFTVRVSVRDPAGLVSEDEMNIVIQAAVPEFPGFPAVTLASAFVVLIALRRRR